MEDLLFHNIRIVFRRLTAESMRWLEMRGKRKKVIDTLNKIAKTNKKPLPDLHQYTQTEVMVKILNNIKCTFSISDCRCN